MTTISRLAVVGLLLLSLVAGVGAVGAAAAPQTETADLAISQPHYADGDVQTTTENESVVYEAGTVPLGISPQNFDAEDVVDYGVETEGGDAELTYDKEFEEFVFEADADGTYEIYFSVEEEVIVENESGNGTDTVTESQRYTASIRLSGVESMVHQPADELDETREDAAKWEDWNETVAGVQERVGQSVFAQVGLVEPPSTEETMQGMVNAYLTIKTPLAMLSGNFTQIVTLIAFSLGGWLFVAVILLPMVALIAGFAYRSQRFEITEADEGRLSKRVGEAQRKEDQQSLANDTHNDIWDDDYLADSMREEGEDPLVAVSNFFSKIRPRYLFHARLQAMAADGWTAVVDERDSDGVPVDAYVAREETVTEETDTEELVVEPDDPLLDALNWGQTEIWEAFDLLTADVDPEEMAETPVNVFDIDELVEVTDLDMRQFDSREQAAQAMAELFEFVRENPIADEHGTPDTLRYGLEHHLRAANLLTDRYHMPLDAYVDLFERAIIDHDVGAEAEETLREIEEGAHA